MSSRPVTARRVALRVLGRIEQDGAYANLALGAELDRSGLDERDRRFATDLVYGTTRMRRACDHLVDGFLLNDVEPVVRTALRLGAYQLHYGDVPAHAAVSETVGCTPRRARGLVNAVLRKVADLEPTWPDEATRLSYPEWIVSTLREDLGGEDAVAALETMNRPPVVDIREDGYRQDLSSQHVVDAVLDLPADRVLDLCAAPGGKATGLAAAGRSVVAADHTAGRTRLLQGNRATTETAFAILQSDGRRAPFADGAFDLVLVDAPCTGLGVLRRRADARWRVEPEAVDRLAALQRELLAEAVRLVRPGGYVVYSVCTLTNAESSGIDEWLAATRPELEAIAPDGPGWRPHGRGGRLLPQDLDRDGMCLFRYRVGS